MRGTIFLLAVLALALFPAEVGAKTTVSVEGTVVTIMVPVDFLGLPEDGGRIIDLDTGEKHAYGPWLEKHGETIWNEGFAAHRYRDCLTFRLDVEVYPVSRPDPRGHHGINFDPLAPGNATVYDPATDNHNDDTASAFEDSLTGDFGLIDGETFAHELGHLMGLGDDYLRDENGHLVDGVVEGREDGTLMHGGENTTITQSIVDRIGKLIDEVEDLPDCWTGTLHAETRRDYRQPESPATCTDSWQGKLRFVVEENGAIEGDGRATLEEVSCPYPFTNPARAHVFTVGGEARGDALVLRLSFGHNVPRDGPQVAAFPNLLVTKSGQVGARPPGPPLEIPRSDDCIAQGDVTATGSVVPYEDPTVARATFDLRCPDDDG